MKPIYFPFTYVADSVARALAACFGEFIVYQPLTGNMPEHMRPWVEKGIIDVRVPVTNDQTDLEAMMKNYLSWADIHLEGSGLKPQFFKAWRDSAPFFSATSPSQIVADIKKRDHGKSASGAQETLLAARRFLYFAQEFDRQNQEVVQDLKRHQQQETELIRQLKMEDDSLTAEFQKEAAQIPDDSAGYMVSERLEAWTRILLEDADISGIFITHIPAVLQELLDRTPTAEKLLSFESIPTCTAKTTEIDPWRRSLASDLAHIVEHKWAPTTGRPSGRPSGPPDVPAEGNTVSLSVYLVPDQMPRVFFPYCAQIGLPDRDVSRPGARFKNTLIGLIEI